MTAVEVIIPVFNDKNRLNYLLTSLAHQTLEPHLFSVIVVDNGSDSPVVIPVGLPFFCRLMFCSSPGSYAARNVAWPAVQAPWIAFTDSDCLPENTWLEAGLEATRVAENGRFPRLLAGRIEMIPSSRQAATSADLLEIYFGMPQERYVRCGGYGITANLWIETSLLKALGGFDARRKSGSDRDFCLRANQLGVKVVYVQSCSLRHPARSRDELAVKARRLIGGRVDAAGSNFARRFVALLMHLKPLLRESWVCWFLPLPLLKRLQMLYLMFVLRIVAMHEWCILVLRSTSSHR
ncbi:glycosyltransferase family 2 protein [Parasynechococcus sp.]|uniref:glycosyltransferase family 2 protein n=1 Tax=Parasynechococcus sp. TaxID=3101203 RepID=UPI00370414E3